MTTHCYWLAQMTMNPWQVEEGHSTQAGGRFAAAAYGDGHLYDNAASVSPSGEQQMQDHCLYEQQQPCTSQRCLHLPKLAVEQPQYGSDGSPPWHA